MRAYLITFHLHDGARGRCHGCFANDWTAIDSVMETFHTARRITVRRLT